MKKIIALMLLLGFGSAQAIPVVWTIQNAAFDDGGHATGYFVFDRDPFAIDGDYLEISITTSSGSDAPGRYYSGQYSFLSGATQLLALDDLDETAAQWVLALIFESPIDDLGGSRSLISVQEGRCGMSTCIPVEAIAREIAAPTASINSVPIPAAVWLFGSGLGLLGWFKRGKAI